MKRIELFEFEDMNWLPSVIRTGATNLLVVFHRMIDSSDAISALIKYASKKVEFDRIVDLGSGSGGAMVQTLESVNVDRGESPIHLMLTDLYPNASIVERTNNSEHTWLSYNKESVNATQFESMPSGLKTMMASFHHMKPEVARGILKSAESNRQPILIYELAKNNVPTLLWWILLPLSLVILFVMALFMTPFDKKLSASQLLFTYLIPVIPIVYAWDGQASLVRTYTFDDVQELIGTDRSSDYVWEIDDAKKSNGKKTGYYIFGYPKK